MVVENHFQEDFINEFMKIMAISSTRALTIIFYTRPDND